jgi:uncharacterized membrane protein YhaH (DUF805 family)
VLIAALHDLTNIEDRMTFTDSIRVCFKKYADFKGCASLSEFWWWILFTLIAGSLIEMVSGRSSSVFTLITFVPTIAAGARRLHDTERSGWLQLLWLIPILGWILLIYWLAQERKVPNKYSAETQELAL